MVAEAQLSNITREKLKAAFTYQFDALREHSEKLAIIAGFGKHLLELVDDTPVTPGETREAYDGYEASKAYVFPLLSISNCHVLSRSQLTTFLPLASSKTAKTLLPIGFPPTQPSAPNSAPAPRISPSAESKPEASATLKALISPAKTRILGTARAGSGSPRVRTASTWTTTKKRRRGARMF